MTYTFQNNLILKNKFQVKKIRLLNDQIKKTTKKYSILINNVL
jgi:hypothetical protein